MGEYKDRSIATIQHDVEKQFKEIEKKNGRWIRDDLEIAQAGIKICWAYIHAIKSDESMNYGEWALEPLKKLQEQLQKEINGMTGRKLFTRNKDQIYNVANRIDNAEREVLKRLRLNNTNRDSRDINNKSETYLKNNETLKQKDFNRLFSGKENIRQGRLWDCYLITTINILSRSQIFEPLIRTSVRIVQWGYTIRLPLWEPHGKTISIKNSELGAAAVQGNIWYKILEIAYAKQTTGESIMTKDSIQKIRGGRPSKALQTLVGKNNIGFTTLWGYYKKDLASNSTSLISSETDSQNLPIPYSTKEIIQVKNTLENYQLARWTKFIAVSSYPGESDQHFYKIEGKQIFYKHAYAVLWVEKDSKGNISRVHIQNPWNKDDKNKPNNGKWNFSLSFENFLKAFPRMDIGNTTRKIFDWKTENGDLSITDNRRRRIKV